MDEISVKIESLIRDGIPIARTMDIRVLASDPHRVELGTPFLGNQNDKGTVFAGCLYSIAVLSGWAYVNRVLLDHGLTASAMVAESSMRYLKPVRGDFRSVCECRDEGKIAEFAAKLKTAGKGSINLETTVSADGIVAARFSGRYVAKI